MRNLITLFGSTLFLITFSLNSFSQANVTLSNLSTTTNINADLLPNANNTRNIGSVARSWKNIYLDGIVYVTDSIFLHNKGTRNTFTGKNAGLALTTALDNTGTGYRSLAAVTTGNYNTGVGAFALNKNTTGVSNTAIGRSALGLNTTGGYNTASGQFALYANTQGINNTGTGYATLYVNTTGGNNVATGFRSLYKNTTGSLNVAIGSNAMNGNITGSYNVGIGPEAMFTSTGSYNTGTGYQALYYNRSSYNSAYGSYALNSSTTGSFLAANGFAALYLNTSGGYNTGFGAYALYSNSTGSGNTAVGYFADVSSTSFTNATALGYNAYATASNQVMLGNSSVTSVKAASSVIIYSDGRFKKNIKEDVPGLEFIKLLKPVTYTYDVHGLDKKMRGNKPAPRLDGAPSTAAEIDEKAMNTKEKIVYTGLIAQDVEKAAADLKYDFSGLYKPQSDNDVYGLSYSEFVVPVIKAIQQLSEQNEELQNKVEKLEKLVTEQSGFLSGAMLKQNSPNPFSNSTTFSYFIPGSTKNGYIEITDMKGSRIQVFKVSPGVGQFTMHKGQLAAGAYNYTLYADGSRVDSKQMIISK